MVEFMTEQEATNLLYRKGVDICAVYEAEYDVQDYPEDIVRIKKFIPELQDVSDITVARLWSTWGEGKYCAGWLIMADEDLVEFKEWVLK